MAESKYKILVEANINTDIKLIQKQLDAISKKLTLNVKANIDMSAFNAQVQNITTQIAKVQKTAIANIASGTGKGTQGQFAFIDDFSKQADGLAKIQNVVADIRKNIGEAPIKLDIVGGEEMEDIKKATITYNDLLGNTVKQTYAWREQIDKNGKAIKDSGEWIHLSNQYTDDGIAKERVKQGELKKTAKYLESMAQKAREAAASTVGKSKGRPEVMNVLDISKQLSDAVKAGDVDKVKQLGTELKTAEKSMAALGKNTLGFGEAMRVALARIVEWGLATSIIYGTFRQFKEGIQYIKDLDKSLTDVQIVTGMNASQVGELSKQYNQLASQLGATTLQVAEGSLEWFRQGKTVQETGELIQSVMALSKLGNMDAAQATELLTSTLNGYKLSATESISIVDKLISVDNAYATSAGEVATALQYSANSAQQAGVSLEELISYITTVSSVTRKSAETIGQSFKTIFARLENVKLGQMFEDDPTTINDVEKALSLVNIKLRETEDTFRPMGEVLEDIAAKWKTMSETEQSAIAGAVAGVRQRENFLVLMENFNIVLDAQQVQLDSAGLALNRYGTYLDSVEGKTNQFIAAWEKLVAGTVNSDTIKFFIDFGTVLLGLVDKLGLLNIAFVALMATVFVKLQVVIPVLTVALDKLAISLFGVGAAATTILPLFVGGAILAVGILGLVKVFDSLNVTTKETYENFQKLKSEADSNVSELNNLALEYETLANKTNRTTEESIRLADIQAILNTKYGALSSGVNVYSDAIDGNTEAIKENILWIKKQAEQEAKNFLEQNKFSYEAAKKKLSQKTGGAYGVWEQEPKNMREQLAFYDEKLSKMESIDSYEYEITAKARDRLYDEISLLEELVVEYEHYQNVVRANTVDPQSRFMTKAERGEFDMPEIDTDGILGATESVFDLSSALDELKTLMDTSLTDAFEDFKNQQDELATKSEELKARIAEALTFPPSEERDAELSKLRGELADTNLAISSTADAYDMATKRILFDIILQRIGQMELSGDMALAAYQTAYMIGEAWGVIDPAMRSTLTAIDGVLATFVTGTANSANAATSIMQALGATAQGIAGDYFINFHVRYIQNNPFPYDNAEGMGISPETSDSPKPTQPPAGGYYPNGFGGGGGGGSDETKKEEKTKEISMQKLLSMVISLIKEEKQAEIDLLETKKDVLDQEQEALDAQLDSYNEIIDARKDLLRTQQEELSYQEEIADRNKSIADLQREIALLSLDNSLEAQSEKLKLEEDLAGELDDLAKTQREHSFDEQEKALDAESELFEKKIDAQKELLEEQKKLIDAQIDTIQEFLNKSGLVAQAAMERMAEKAPSLYEELIAWNDEYGSGIKEDVTDAWDEAYLALKRFKDLVDAIRGGSVPESYTGAGDGGGGSNLNWKRQYGIPEGSADWEDAVKLGKKKFLEKHPEYTKKFHTGLAAGPVGEYKTSAGEVFATLFKGERVINKEDMISIMRRIPELANSMVDSSTGISIKNLINIEGNVDKNIMPKLQDITKNIMQEIQFNLIKKGYTRDAKLFSM